MKILLSLLINTPSTKGESTVVFAVLSAPKQHVKRYGNTTQNSGNCPDKGLCINIMPKVLFLYILSNTLPSLLIPTWSPKLLPVYISLQFGTMLTLPDLIYCMPQRWLASLRPSKTYYTCINSGGLELMSCPTGAPFLTLSIYHSTRPSFLNCILMLNLNPFSSCALYKLIICCGQWQCSCGKNKHTVAPSPTVYYDSTLPPCSNS